MVKLRHIGIVVNDMDTSIQLYKDIFNLEVIWNKIEKGNFIDKLLGIDNVKVHTVKLKDSNGGIIELLQYISHPTLPTYDKINRIGCSHFAITVDNIDNIYKKLIKFGLKFKNKPQISADGNVKVAFCRDQDKVLIEIVEELK